MADSAAFEAACACLEKSRLAQQPRGAWYDPTRTQSGRFRGEDRHAAGARRGGPASAPAELRSRRVDDPEGICTKIARTLEGMTSDSASETAEAVFERLGGA